LKYRVLSLSSRESRLELANSSRLPLRKVQVNIRPDPNAGVDWWTQIAQLGSIPFHFDGETMDIVFTTTVTLRAGEAIYIDLPPDTDIANVDCRACYQHWIPGPGSPTQQVAMGIAGAYSRGPRLQSDHVS
jgi:hypothetical protein